jgi:hypothetical protein
MAKTHLSFTCLLMYSSIKMLEKYPEELFIGARRNLSGA